MFWSLRDMGVAVMLRDEDGWWRSSADRHPAYQLAQPARHGYVLDPKSLSWTQFRDTADMDEVDDGGAVPLAECGRYARLDLDRRHGCDGGPRYARG